MDIKSLVVSTIAIASIALSAVCSTDAVILRARMQPLGTFGKDRSMDFTYCENLAHALAKKCSEGYAVPPPVALSRSQSSSLSQVTAEVSEETRQSNADLGFTVGGNSAPSTPTVDTALWAAEQHRAAAASRTEQMVLKAEGPPRYQAANVELFGWFGEYAHTALDQERAAAAAYASTFQSHASTMYSTAQPSTSFRSVKSTTLNPSSAPAQAEDEEDAQNYTDPSADAVQRFASIVAAASTKFDMAGHASDEKRRARRSGDEPDWEAIAYGTDARTSGEQSAFSEEGENFQDGAEDSTDSVYSVW